MKKVIFLLALVCTVLLLLVSVTAAQEAPRCNGLLTALDHIPPDRPTYARLLEMADEECGWALDHAALLAFYYSTDSDWPVDTIDDHCYWTYVACNVDHRVDELVYDVGLNGSIPPELGNLSNLVFLHLANNNLTGSIPPELGNLSNLVLLDLGENQLSGPIPAELGNLNNLLFLSLDNNQLSGPIPAELGNLSDLESLHLNSQVGEQLTCWENQPVLDWASSLTNGLWDDPPGTAICEP